MTESAVKTRITLDLPLGATKEQEAEFLAKLVGFFAHRQETYLNDLFTPELSEYTEKAMRNDFQPNVIEALDSATKTALENHAAAVENEITCKSAAQSAQRWEAMWNEAKRQAGEDFRSAAHEYEKLENRITEQAGQLEDAENKASSQQQEIDRLKVKLFDLMEAQEK